MTKMDVFTEQLALAEIDATFYNAKIDKTPAKSSDWWEFLRKRDDALIRIRACKFLMKQEKLREGDK